MRNFSAQARRIRSKAIPPPLIVAGTTTLVVAASLLLSKPAEAKSAKRASNAAVCRAVGQNDAEGLHRLIGRGFHADDRHPLGWAPLHVAVVQGNHDMVRLLLKEGADADISDQFSFEDLATSRRISISEILRVRQMEFSRRIPPQSSTNGFSPLHYAVVFDDFEMVKILLNHGANPIAVDGEGLQPLDYVDPGETTNGDNIHKFLQHAVTKHNQEMERYEKEMRRKFPLEARLKEHIVGQLGAINTVASCIRRRENGWHDEDHPLVFLFLGSSGIGKTEMAKRLAQYLHPDDKEGFVRIDMSEFQSKHEVAKFIGSPPGYVGFEEGGMLTEKLKKNPKAVVLLDEVEKAHADVLTILLQLFDEGRLTDGQGKTVHCPEAIFVMTSNLAQDEIADHGMFLREELRRREEGKMNRMIKSNEEEENTAIPAASEIEVTKHFRDNVIRPILKAHFKRNEFLGRINEIVYFLPFSKSELNELVQMELNRWKEKAEARHGVEITWTDDVVTALTSGYDVHYGARSLKYEVDRRLINQMASMWEQDIVQKGAKLHVYLDNDEVKVKCENPAGSLSRFLGFTGA
eukprot:CFRG1993T1